MAVEEALVLRSEALERPPTLSIVRVGAETQEENEASPVLQPNFNNEFDLFFRSAAETLSSLGKFTLRHEIARVRLMTGDFVGIDYAEGVYRPIDLNATPQGIDDQKAERLRWIAALASVSQKADTKVSPPNPRRSREVKAHRKVRVYDRRLKDIADKAITLHFELRRGKTHEEIIEEIEGHFDQLIQKEAYIYKNYEIFSGGVFVENDEERAEIEQRFKHSLHRKHRLQATLHGLTEGKIIALA